MFLIDFFDKSRAPRLKAQPKGDVLETSYLAGLRGTVVLPSPQFFFARAFVCAA